MRSKDPPKHREVIPRIPEVLLIVKCSLGGGRGREKSTYKMHCQL